MISKTKVVNADIVAHYGGQVRANSCNWAENDAAVAL